MPATQPPLPVARPYRNQGLFSDYYLEGILPRRPEWQRLAEVAAPALARIARIVAAYHPSSNEAQTENDLIRPVLLELGHTFEVQAPLRTPAGTKRPDYVFYTDAAARDARKGQVLTDALLNPGAFAVGDAKQWDRPLDSVLESRARDELTNHPMAQMAFYMRHSRVEWGILTNGRVWRLLHRDSVERLDRFYEVDLPLLVETGNVAAFLAFYGFFGRAAFAPEQEAGAPGVAAILRASTD